MEMVFLDIKGEVTWFFGSIFFGKGEDCLNFETHHLSLEKMVFERVNTNNIKSSHNFTYLVTFHHRENAKHHPHIHCI